MTRDELNRLEQRVEAYMAGEIAGAADTSAFTLKRDHTRRVCAHIRLLARSLALPGEAENRAAAAALVHDLGRFPQFRRFGTFSDPQSQNHAALGTGVICRRGVLAEIARREKQLILRAVALHNRPELPENLPRELTLLARMLRDADKMDIFKVMADLYAGPENGGVSFITHHHPDDGNISPDLLAQVASLQRVPYSGVRTLNDMKLFQLSMVFDLNFPAALEQMLDKGRIESIIRSMPRDNRLAALERRLVRYMRDRAGR